MEHLGNTLEHDERVILHGTAFRVIPHLECLIEDADPYNVLDYGKFHREGENYRIPYDPRSRKLAEGMDGEAITVARSILDDGYLEGSDLARDFNQQHAAEGGILLVDRELQVRLEKEPIRFADQRSLPELDIYGTPFEIDVSFDLLRSKRNPFQVLKFEDMDQNPAGGYDFRYNRKWGHLVDMADSEDVVAVHIAEKVQLDPDGISEVYGISKDRLPERDHQLKSDPTLFERRVLHGALPEIRVHNRLYYIDERMGELREVTNFMNRIGLGEDHDFYDDGPVAFYDCRNHREFELTDDICKMPRDLALIMFPSLTRMDPVYWGRKMCGDPAGILSEAPLQHRLTARIHDIRWSGLEEAIKENKKEKMLRKGRGI